jgi:hypothetical protein
MMIDGRMASIVQHVAMCKKGNTMSTLYIAEADDKIETRTDTDTSWTLLDPPSDGHTWNTAEMGPELDCTWHRAGDVTVAAGKFPDCWVAETMASGGDQQTTYCRGVGKVLTEQTTSSNATVHVELTMKSF